MYMLFRGYTPDAGQRVWELRSHKGTPHCGGKQAAEKQGVGTPSPGEHLNLQRKVLDEPATHCITTANNTDTLSSANSEMG